MTSEYERGHAAGREAGIREAADARPSTYAIYGADRTDAYAKGYCGGVEAYRQSILSLLDSQPAPAGVTVQEAAKIADAVWSEYSDSIKEKWTFRKEHVENAIRRALSEDRT